MVSVKCIQVLNTAFLFQVLLGTLIKAQSSPSPQITTQPQNSTVSPNNRATLQCGASGTPLPTISWYKDDTIVTTDSRISINSQGSLLIENPRVSDEGMYHCVANNTAGSVQSRRATLQIAVLSTVISDTTTQLQLPRFSPQVLECALPTQSIPYPPRVTWTSVTSQQMNSGRITVTLNGSLVFSSWEQLMDGMIFQCEVTNLVLGTTQQSSSYLLRQSGGSDLIQPTDIVVPPVPLQTAVVGDSVHFECFTTGSPIATISWLKDGSPVGSSVTTSQAGRILTISSVTTADAGTYTCEASPPTNPSDIDTASGRLEVIVPPRITSSFPQTTVNVTLPVSLTCRSEGTLPLQWTWKRDTQTLSNNGGVSFNTSGAESTLTITSIRISDGGVYQCVVEQPSTGRTAAANELLVARATSPQFTHGQSLTDKLVLAMDTVLLPCTATGFPPPDFEWNRFQSGMPQPLDINALSRYSLPPSGTLNNGTLVITNAQVGDIGTLTCTARNVDGSVITPAIQLVVIEPPTPDQTPESIIRVTAGNTVQLPCSVSLSRSDISVRYQWSRDGQEIEAAQGSTGTYTIPNFTEMDNGIYECTAWLSLASINALPIASLVSTSVVSVGEPVPPSPPLTPMATMKTATSFTATWNPPAFNGRLQLSNYTVELQSFGNSVCPGDLTFQPVATGIQPNATSVMVESLYPSMEYQFRVIAFNFLYRSDPSTVSNTFRTLSSAPLAPPSNVRLEITQSAAELTIHWEDPSPCSRGGELTGYIVQYRRPSSTSLFTDEVVPQGSTVYVLSDLLPSATYDIRMAARNSEGTGPYSEIMSATTAELSSITTVEPPTEPPTGVTVTEINSTSVVLSWGVPIINDCNELRGYRVTYVESDGRLFILRFNASVTSTTVTDLKHDNQYTFRFSANCTNGLISFANHTITLPAPDSEALFYEEIWFYAVVAVVGALVLTVLIVAVVLICCKVCWKCGSEDGKIYITTRRSASSLSGASSGFSEYQRKNKVLSRIVKVHESPTPSRRTTDYADLESIRPAPSTIGTISLNYTDSVVSEQVNGRQHQHFHNQHHQHHHHQHHHNHHGEHYPDDHFIQGGQQYPHEHLPPNSGAPNPRFGVDSPEGVDYPINDMDIQPHHMRGESLSQRFVDTLTRVHTPPPALRESPEHNMGSPPRMSSPHDVDSQNDYSGEDNETWNPANHLNHKGHMSNKPVSRSNSGRSTQSSKSFESGRGHPSNFHQDPHQHKRRQLSPLHENQFSEKRGHLGSHHLQAQAMSVQELHNRSCAMSDHTSPHAVDDHAMRMQRAQSMDQNFGIQMKSRQPPIGMEMKQLPSVATEKHHMGNHPPHREQQLSSPPPPDYGQNYDHETHRLHQNTSPIPNPHVVEYGLNPPVHLSFSHSIEQQEHSQPTHTIRGQRPVNYYPVKKHPMHEHPPSPEHYPRNEPMLNQPQMSMPPPGPSHQRRPHPQRPLNYPQIEIKSPSKADGPTYLATSEVTPVKNYPPNRTTSPPLPHPNQPTRSNGAGSPVYSIPLNVPKKSHTNIQPSPQTPELPKGPPPPPSSQQQQRQQQQQQQQQQLNTLYIDQSFINNPGDSLDSGVGHSIDRKQVKTHPSKPPAHQGDVVRGGIDPTRQQSVPALVHNLPHQRQISEPVLPMYATPANQPSVLNTTIDLNTSANSRQFNGFERAPPMSSSHSIDTLDSSMSQQQNGWDSDIDRIQQQFELSVQNMQTLLSSTAENGFPSSLDTSQNNGSATHIHNKQIITSTPNITKPPVATKPKPQVAPKPTVAPKPSSSSKLLKSSSQSNTKLNGPEFDPKSLAINKLRPSIPDLGQLTDMDPKKPKIKQGKVRRAVWEPRPMNRAIESSSDSESDTGSEYSIDSVLQPGDNTSLKSSHV